MMPALMDVLNGVMATPLHATAAAMMFVFVAVFALAHIHRNYSWVDRSWSVVPVMYAWIIAGYTCTQQHNYVHVANLYALVLTVWGARLTYNFHRRGGYRRGGEDYRWMYVQRWPIFGRHPWLWVVFNFFIISLFQTCLLWAIALPCLSFAATPITAKDGLFAAAMLGLILLETLFDQQQWIFQQGKLAHGDANGFCITGLFGYSRHLNVFCEGSLWVVLAVAASQQPGGMVWWQWIGCLVLEVLIVCSAAFITERISCTKYPAYHIYQQTTPMLFPSMFSCTNRTRFLIRQAHEKSA